MNTYTDIHIRKDSLIAFMNAAALTLAYKKGSLVHSCGRLEKLVTN